MASIAIVGGGSASYTLISLLSSSGHSVRLLSSRADQWEKSVSCIFQFEGQAEFCRSGELSSVSDNPRGFFDDVDIVILCMPVHTYRHAVNHITAYFPKDRDIKLGTIYGQGGFNWMCEEAFKKHSLSKSSYWAIGLIPWICRTKTYGSAGINFGIKKNNVIATSSDECFEYLSNTILEDLALRHFHAGEFHCTDSFLALSLSVDNQIIHPTRCYSLYKEATQGWTRTSDIPMFYADYDEHSANLLQAVDAEYSLIRNAISNEFSDKEFRYMMDYLTLERFSYGSDSEDIKSSFTNSSTLSTIATPTVKSGSKIVLDGDHRFFRDDIVYGLNIARFFGQMYSIQTPNIQLVTDWANDFMKEQGLSQENMADGLPNSYDITPDLWFS